jgi:hypothetical protein
VDGRKLVLAEVVLERERLENALLEGAALLRLVDYGLDWGFKQGRAQFVSLPSVRWGYGDTQTRGPRARMKTTAALGVFR